MTLLYMRHGQTDWNVQGLFQGRTDIPLNETGRGQAREQAKALSHEPPIDIIYASPLLRARETAEIVQQTLDVPLHFDDRLVERCFGSLEGTVIVRGQLDEEGLARHGAEPFAALHERVKDFLDDIAARHPEQCVLVVAHGGVGRMVQYFCHEGETVRIENGALMRYTY